MTDGPGTLQRNRWLGIALPALLALGLCVFRIGVRETWPDEHATWWAASLPRPAFWRLLSNVDAVLAPYYMLMRGVVALIGDAPSALRLPSAVAMALAAALTSALGSRLFNERVGLWAGLLFAFIPSVSRYGQEARPYALVVAASVLSVLLLLRALEAPSSWSRWAAYSVSLIVLGGLHAVALTNLLAHASTLIERAEGTRWPHLRRPACWYWLLSLLFALALLAPLFWLGAQQSAQIAWTEHLSNDLRGVPKLLFRVRSMGLVFVVASLLALRRLDRAHGLLLGWAFAPLLLLSATHSVLHLFVHRYLLFTLPAFALLTAALLDELSRAAPLTRVPLWLRRVAPWGALLGIAALGWRAQARARATAPEALPYELAVAQIAAHSQAGDAVAYAGGAGAYRTRIALAYHWRGPDTPRDIFVSRPAVEVGRFAAEECQNAEVCLPPDVNRLWLMTTSSREQLFGSMPWRRAQLLQREFRVADVSAHGKLLLALLVRTTSRAEPAETER